MDEKNIPAQLKLKGQVVDTSLCTFCGACCGCPYITHYKGRITYLDQCNLQDGNCYKYCPMTYADLDKLSQKIFGQNYPTEPYGIVQEAFLAKSSDPAIQEKGQDGGVVTALLNFAIKENYIDGAIETKSMGADQRPQGYISRTRDELLRCSGSIYEASPVLETIHNIPQDSQEKFGFVGLPCQIKALTKMKYEPPKNRFDIDNIKLTIGLFCGWAFSQPLFHDFLIKNVDVSNVLKYDIPHSPGHSFDVYTDSGKQSFDLEDVKEFINSACQYCWDMTAEFSDISVGSGRAKHKGWNTVLIRSKSGLEFIERARSQNVLEIRELPAENIENLRKASANKKKGCLANIIQKDGSKHGLKDLGIPEQIIETYQT